MSNKKSRVKRNRDLEQKVFRIASLGTIATGMVACVSSVTVGLSLILLGTVVFSEL